MLNSSFKFLLDFYSRILNFTLFLQMSLHWKTFLHSSFIFLTLLAVYFQLASSNYTCRVICQTQPCKFSKRLLNFCSRFSDRWSRPSAGGWVMGGSLVHHALRASVCPLLLTRAVFISSDRWFVSSKFHQRETSSRRRRTSSSGWSK